MLRGLLIAGTLSFVACGAASKPQVVTKVVAPEPCHIPAFPPLPDLAPVVIDVPQGEDPDAGVAQVVVFTAPDFTLLATWLDEVNDWEQTVERCQGVKVDQGAVAYYPVPSVHEVFYTWDLLYNPLAVDVAFGYNINPEYGY